MAFDSVPHRWQSPPPKRKKAPDALDILAWPVTRLWHIRAEIMKRRSFFKLSPFALIGLCFYTSVAATLILGGAGVMTDYGAPWWYGAAFVALVSWIHGIPAAYETRA